MDCLGNHFGLVSRELTCPTNVKGNSSSQLLSDGICWEGISYPHKKTMSSISQRHWLSPDALPFFELELTAEKHLEAGISLMLRRGVRGMKSLSKCIGTNHNNQAVVDTKSFC